jgi:hypothetical protein
VGRRDRNSFAKDPTIRYLMKYGVDATHAFRAFKPRSRTREAGLIPNEVIFLSQMGDNTRYEVLLKRRKKMLRLLKIRGEHSRNNQ